MDRKANLTLQNGRYEILSQLGNGGIATVLRVLDHKFDIERAIKVFTPRHSIGDEPNVTAKRFFQEAKLLTHLQHNNIVSIFDYFDENGSLHIVMEKCAGSLDSWMSIHHQMPMRLVVQVIIQVLRGLQKAHQKGIVHRDIKPHNILISTEGIIKVADFGLALTSFGAESLTQSNALLGSVQFMSPEQRNDPSKVDIPSDLYSVTMTMVWLLEARVVGDLYIQSTLDHLQEHYPMELIEIIRKGGMLKPKERYANCVEMLQDLEMILPNLPEHNKTLMGVVSEERPIHHSQGRHSSPQLMADSQTAFNSQTGSVEMVVPSSLQYILFGIVALLLISVGLSIYLLEFREASSTENTISISHPKCEHFLARTQRVRLTGPEETINLKIVDIDADGYQDAVYSNQLAKSYSIFWNDSVGSFEEAVILNSLRSNTNILVGDIDNDGIQDLVGLHEEQEKISIHKGLGNRQFRDLEVYGRDYMLQAPPPKQGVLVDLNEDGWLDLLFATSKNQVFLRLNAKKGLDYPILDLPNVEEEPFHWHREVAQAGFPVWLVDGFANLYWIEENSLRKSTIQANLSISISSKLIEDMSDLTLLEIQMVEGGEQIYFVNSQHQLLRWQENQGFCILQDDFSVAILDKNFYPKVSFTDWNHDGVLDYLSYRSCWYCTSNHILYLGVPE